MAEKELTQLKPQSSDRWGSPKLSAKLDQLRKDSTLRSKWTGLCVASVVMLWLRESCCGWWCVHKLKQQFTAMTEEALLFWLPKFVAEEQWESLSSEQCVSNLLWAEQGSKISQPGGYWHVQRPKVHSVLRYRKSENIRVANFHVINFHVKKFSRSWWALKIF